MGKEMEAVEKEIEISMAEVNVDDSSMPQTDLLAKLDHPYRYELTNELHARPFERIEAPAKATFYAMTSGEGGAKRDRAHVKELCARMGVNPPSDSSNHFSADFGAFRLRWERHSEFSTYTFLVEGEFVDPFSHMPVSKVPADWLQSLPGERIVAVHVAFMGAEKEVPDEKTMRKWLARGCLVTSNIASDEAQVWTDFQIHGDGHSRVLIKNRELNGWKAGRVLQRVLEVMTYSNMALMTLPLARKAAAQMVHMDAALASLTSRIAQNEDGEEQEPDSDYVGSASNAIQEGKLPETARSFVMENGTIGNTHFVAIPYNSAHKQAAQVVANFLMSPEAQARKQNPEYWGEITVLSMSLLDEDSKARFNNIPRHEATLSNDELGKSLSEPHSSWMTMIEAEWLSKFGS